MRFDNINNKEYMKQLKYFNDYYGSAFKNGQGTEEILDLINKYSTNGTLIDFGSGSNIYFWLLAFNQIDKVKCVDISKEAFYLNEQIRKKELYPKSCDYPINKYDKNYEKILNTNIDYLIYDILNRPLVIDEKYDNVSQFGLLGLCRNKGEYIENLSKLFRLLKKDGILLGANWYFSDLYSKKMGFSNNYLSEQLIADFSDKVNCNVLVSKLIPIKDDLNYSYVLIYAIKNG